MLRAARLQDVTFDGGFWAERLRTNRLVTIPRQLELLERTGRIDAFRLDWKPGRPNRPHYFWDSDVAKWIEAASHSLATHPDRVLEARLDEVIALVAAAQQPDGYLNVYFTVVEPGRRWTNLRDWHELYCAGHLIEAAVAHHAATGKRTLLDPLVRYADHIDARFGPRSRSRAFPGHEEIELALVKLYRATGQQRYLDLARHLIDARGQPPHYFDVEARARGEDPAAWEWTYDKNQSHLPVRRQRDAVGHAVRATYLYSGMTDVAAGTGDRALRAACRRLWRSATGRKMYVTGGVGAVRRGEAFGDDYYLPNRTAYAETCAAIGLIFFAHRMLHLARDGAYADVAERALYNGVLASASRDGRRFFYDNPLASEGNHHRQDWFDCACCPPNLARLLASLGSYLIAVDDDSRTVYVHHYAAGAAEVALDDARVTIAQRTRYPWDGRIDLVIGVDRPANFALALRVPGWCARHAIALNGKPVRVTVRRGYAVIRRAWRGGDRVTLRLDMPVQRVVAHARVRENVGRVALQRGPIIFCVEQCDQTVPVGLIRVPDRARIIPVWRAKLLGGATVLQFDARVPAVPRRVTSLYAPLQMSRGGRRRRVRVTAVPYFLWDNRQAGPMAVWMPRES